MSLPPCLSDLEVGQIFLSPYLAQLLNTILSGKRDCSDTSSKCKRPKQSFGQDMIYAVSNGKIKTPKSISPSNKNSYKQHRNHKYNK